MCSSDKPPILLFPSLRSSNLTAHCYAAGGVPDAFAVSSLLQTQGYGSRGRHWQSTTGNLYISFVLGEVSLQDISPTLMVILASLSIFDTLATLPLKENVQIKWPNDILISKRKVSGILIEHSMEENRSHYGIIGIGLNVLSFPKDTNLSACCIADFVETPPSLGELRYLLQSQILKNLASIEKNSQEVMHRYQENLFGLGSLLRVRLQGKDLTGMLTGVDQKGALLLETNTGVQTLYSGDIIMKSQED